MMHLCLMFCVQRKRKILHSHAEFSLFDILEEEHWACSEATCKNSLLPCVKEASKSSSSLDDFCPDVLIFCICLKAVRKYSLRCCKKKKCTTVKAFLANYIQYHVPELTLFYSNKCLESNSPLRRVFFWLVPLTHPSTLFFFFSLYQDVVS